MARQKDVIRDRVKFGLEAQGHIPTVEKMLDMYGSTRYAWNEIGKKIGWCEVSARDGYIRYLMRQKQKRVVITEDKDIKIAFDSIRFFLYVIIAIQIYFIYSQITN